MKIRLIITTMLLAAATLSACSSGEKTPATVSTSEATPVITDAATPTDKPVIPTKTPTDIPSDVPTDTPTAAPTDTISDIPTNVNMTKNDLLSLFTSTEQKSVYSVTVTKESDPDSGIDFMKLREAAHIAGYDSLQINVIQDNAERTIFGVDNTMSLYCFDKKTGTACVIHDSFSRFEVSYNFLYLAEEPDGNRKVDIDKKKIYIRSADESSTVKINTETNDEWARVFYPDWKNNVLITETIVWIEAGEGEFIELRCYSMETGELISEFISEGWINPIIDTEEGICLKESYGLSFLKAHDTLYAWDYLNGGIVDKHAYYSHYRNDKAELSNDIRSLRSEIEEKYGIYIDINSESSGIFDEPCEDNSKILEALTAIRNTLGGYPENVFENMPKTCSRTYCIALGGKIREYEENNSLRKDANGISAKTRSLYEFYQIFDLTAGEFEDVIDYSLKDYIDAELLGKVTRYNRYTEQRFKFENSVIALEIPMNSYEDDFYLVLYDAETDKEIKSIYFESYYLYVDSIDSPEIIQGKNTIVVDNKQPLGSNGDGNTFTHRLFVYDSQLNEVAAFEIDGDYCLGNKYYDEEKGIIIFQNDPDDETIEFNEYNIKTGELKILDKSIIKPAGKYYNIHGLIDGTKLFYTEGTQENTADESPSYSYRSFIIDIYTGEQREISLPHGGFFNELYPVRIITERNGKRYINAAFAEKVLEAPYYDENVPGELHIYDIDGKTNVKVEISNPLETCTVIADWENNILITLDYVYYSIRWDVDPGNCTFRAYSMKTGKLLAVGPTWYDINESMPFKIDPENRRLYLGDQLVWEYK